MRQATKTSAVVALTAVLSGIAVAVRSSTTEVLVRRRLLGLDPTGIGFNLYRATDGGGETKLNSSALTGGTNFVDSTADASRATSYRVRPVVSGVEQAPSGAFTPAANRAVEPVVRVPLRAGGAVKFLWVGDLDGDGEYDYVLDRQTSPQKIEAYRRDGRFPWQVDMGPNSTDQDNIEGGSATIDVGHDDGVTVQDLDSDGRAEVAVRIADGVTFGNGVRFTDSDDNRRLRYTLGPAGVVHGDRFHIADLDPSRPGLEGYGVQQVNPSGLRDYYYDAVNGTIIRRHTESGTADVGRGMAGDVDPRHPGMEVWASSGLHNAATNRLTQSSTSLQPWPRLGLHWDGDTTVELLNDDKFEKWNPTSPTTTNSVPRLLATSQYGVVDAAQGNSPVIYRDILGDWREEIHYTNAAFNELIIFTTNRPSGTRLCTLAHNPAYRNAMTLKGSLQSHHVDYFLGANMAAPPRPDITYPSR